MFRVSTVHLSPDATTASPTLGTTDLGEISAADLLTLLQRLRDVDALQVVDAEPHLLVVARSGRFIVRTGRKKLFLYDARDAVQPYAELTAEEIVAQLERNVAPSPPPADAVSAEAAAAVRRAAPHRGIAAAILAAGLALNGYTLYSVFYTESVNEPPAVTLLTDPDDLAARQHAVLGVYVTGDKPGDRAITVLPDGRIKFTELGSTSGVVNNTDTYRLGKRANKFCLATAESGVIDIFDGDTLIYFRDSYRRK